MVRLGKVGTSTGAFVLALGLLLPSCGSDKRPLSGQQASSSTTPDSLPAPNTNPTEDEQLALGLVLLRIEGCIPDDLSQSASGMRVRQVAPGRYRVYFLRLSDGATEQGGYDETAWAAYDIDLDKAKPLRGKAVPGVDAVASSPLYGELLRRDCVASVAGSY